MKKILPQTKNITDENVENIAQLFPQVITETKDENGNVKKVVDFELLKQHLSENIVDGSDERYRLDWPGKRASILKANTPINKTLRPDRESSVNFDETENVYIEGDNFEVLKVLQESYLGKIKMIYIDPPYNTGKDFVYTDKFAKSKDDYEDEIGVEDSEGGKLFKNTDTNGRFHSDWLSMMYERLIVARDLLTDDGVIFMSIDDNEVYNLRKIADEVFGEENLINSICIKMSELSGMKMSNVNKFPKLGEYLLVYSKRSELVNLNIGKIRKVNLDNYLKYYSKIILNPEDEAEKWEIVSIKDYFIKNGLEYSDEILKEFKLKNAERIVYRTNSKTIEKYIEENTNSPEIVTFNNSEGSVVVKWGDKEMLFLSNYIDEYIGDIWMDISTINLNKETYGIPTYSNGQKPVKLISRILDSVCSDGDITLDFFAGSGTTADAVIRYNFENEKNIKFIMVQVDERIEILSGMDQATKKTTRKLMDFLNDINKPLLLNEIGKERIRRAGKKIVGENSEKLAERETPLDIGFRVYKTDSSNIKDVYYNPAELKQDNLLDMVDNIKDDRNSEDLLTQVILDLGLTLDLPIETKDIDGVEVFYVAGNSLVACFDADISDTVLKTIAESEPIRVVFRDSSFKQTEDKINVETIFKSVSPDTKIIVL